LGQIESFGISGLNGLFGQFGRQIFGRADFSVRSGIASYCQFFIDKPNSAQQRQHGSHDNDKVLRLTEPASFNILLFVCLCLLLVQLLL
jgi:hypothetical protein